MQTSRPWNGRLHPVDPRTTETVVLATRASQDFANGREPMTRSRLTLSMCSIVVSCVVTTWTLTLALAQPVPSDPGLPTQPADASPRELRVLGGRTDYSVVTPKKASPQELPTWRIPNIPSSAEAYYA